MTFYVTFLLFMMFFFFVAAYTEHIKPAYGHQTGATVMLGITWSFLFYWFKGNDPHAIAQYTFNSTSFFDFILPPLIYNAGFNMRRRKFFVELGNQLLFGLFVTLFCFVLYAFLSFIALSSFDFKMT